MSTAKGSNLGIAIAIVIAGAFIALALFLSGQSASGLPANSGHTQGSFANNNSGTASSIRTVSDTDHIFGNPDAPVTIVEFSDFECPFCQRLHPTLSRVVEESDGQVRWVYRHFPLSSIHPQAESAAAASECVARLAGNDAFWEFGSFLFENQRRLGTALYAEGGARFGISEGDLTSCMNERGIRSRVTGDFNEAIAAGGRGTPFSVIISASGQFFPFSGALPYEQVTSLIEQALVN
ncbi:MAG: DsbA family protein [Candidatus Paceibacteria bacterium]